MVVVVVVVVSESSSLVVIGSTELSPVAFVVPSLISSVLVVVTSSMTTSGSSSRLGFMWIGPTRRFSSRSVRSVDVVDGSLLVLAKVVVVEEIDSWVPLGFVVVVGVAVDVDVAASVGGLPVVVPIVEVEAEVVLVVLGLLVVDVVVVGNDGVDRSRHSCCQACFLMARWPMFRSNCCGEHSAESRQANCEFTLNGSGNTLWLAESIVNRRKKCT